MKKIVLKILLPIILVLGVVGCATVSVNNGINTSNPSSSDNVINNPTSSSEDIKDSNDDLPEPGETPEPDVVPDFETDPYVNVTPEEFYENYYPAVCLKDAMYRSEHFFMSGSLKVPNQAPTIAENKPEIDGALIHNAESYYSEDKKEYTVHDVYNNPVFTVYEGGAYITLEEVAAYVYAFGNVPSNYTSSTRRKPTDSPWGKYFRLNYNDFSGDTNRYPFEPVLPEISGVDNGRLGYKEIDIGTTGTDCSPSYPAAPYNDGKYITRGAARIVFSEYDFEKDAKITELKDRYVFYTFNHYNDFQEYLNYKNGWGEVFGNITGGGALSSKHDYNPTSYIKTIRQYLTPITY